MTNKTRKEQRKEKDQVKIMKEKFLKMGSEMATKAGNASKLIKSEASKNYEKFKTEAAAKMEERKKKKEESEVKMKLEILEKEEKARKLECKVGAWIHQQKTDYGKGATDFYFGGYINEHTISIAVENVMGVRSYSSNFYIQVKVGTKFELPGLFNDKTGEFDYIELEVTKIEAELNKIHLDKKIKK